MTDTERIADLERRVAELDKAARDQHPLGPQRPIVPVWPDGWDKLVPSEPWVEPMTVEVCCHVCNLKAENATHYVCINEACPGRISYHA